MRRTVATEHGNPQYQAILHPMLADVPLLATLPPTTLSRLAAISPTTTVTANKVIATRGEPATHLLVVTTGGLTAVHETEDGHRRRLGEFPAPCAVDKAAVLDGQGHTATWLTTTRTTLTRIPAKSFLALIDIPTIRTHVFTHLATQLRTQQTNLVLTSYTDATTRVATWLVMTATPTPQLPGTQQGLAETLGLTRVTVNRALKTLERENLIKIEQNNIKILAPELLATRAAKADHPAGN